MSRLTVAWVTSNPSWRSLSTSSFWVPISSRRTISWMARCRSALLPIRGSYRFQSSLTKSSIRWATSRLESRGSSTTRPSRRIRVTSFSGLPKPTPSRPT